MPQQEMCSSALYELSHLHGTVVVGKMPVYRENALFQIQRIRTCTKHILVVIGLDENHSAARKSFVHFLRNVSQIGTHSAVLVVLGMYTVAAALYSIVGRIEAAYLTAASAYSLARDVYDMRAYRDLAAVTKPL